MNTVNPERPQILLVTAAADDMDMLLHLLQAEFEIQSVSSAEQAWSILSSEKLPDLILLDSALPDSDGSTFCRKLKGDLRSQTIPLLIMTDTTAGEALEQGFDLGVADYINKPVAAPLLLARVRTHVMLQQKTVLLEKLAMLDGLTGLANRQRFEIELEQEWRRAVRNEAPLSIVMVDIDHFTEYNDNYGHGKGDLALQQIARIMSDCLARPGDLLARTSGETFFAVLQNADAEGAWLVAEQFRSKLEEAAISHEHSPVAAYLTLSAGCASMLPAQDGGTMMQLMDEADRMLTNAKQGGRNQVCS